MEHLGQRAGRAGRTHVPYIRTVTEHAGSSAESGKKERDLKNNGF